MDEATADGTGAARFPGLEKVLVSCFASTGAVGFVWCFYAHICMEGHMQHPPYPGWHYVLDGAWATLWVSGALLSMRGSRAWKVVGSVLLVLLGYRFCLGSLGGMLPLPV